jgi:hypothetical protein
MNYKNLKDNLAKTVGISIIGLGSMFYQNSHAQTKQPVAQDSVEVSAIVMSEFLGKAIDAKTNKTFNYYGFYIDYNRNDVRCGVKCTPNQLKTLDSLINKYTRINFKVPKKVVTDIYVKGNDYSVGIFPEQIIKIDNLKKEEIAKLLKLKKK